MTNYGLMIDLTKCTGCYNCLLACRDEFAGNDFPPYSMSQPAVGPSWMSIIEKERGKYPQTIRVAYIPVPCMHCQEPSCVKAAGNGEIYRRNDGIVIIDPEKSRGRKDLVSSCPYRVIYWNDEKNIPQKCTLCAHLIDAGWQEPRCVEACPTGALIFGDLDDPASAVSGLAASGRFAALNAEYRMHENVMYSGLPTRFIAGSVVFGDTDECADNVTVSLVADGKNFTTRTNSFGDFEFEGLQAETEYSVRIGPAGYNPIEFKVATGDDVYLGEIVLARTAT